MAMDKAKMRGENRMKDSKPTGMRGYGSVGNARYPKPKTTPVYTTGPKTMYSKGTKKCPTCGK